jgi:hypothetical protein
MRSSGLAYYALMALTDFRAAANIAALEFGVRKMPANHTLTRLRLPASLMVLLCVQGYAAAPPVAAQRDGAHDFDFIIGDWKAHVRRLPDRLNGSTQWIDYDGISRHKKILDSNANFEEFEVDGREKGQHIKAQTLRLYNPESHQWTIYLVDVDKGILSTPPVVGEFTGRRGEFYDQEDYKGRAILVRYVWSDISPQSARMEQSFSADGGKSWEVNWICELTR